jgi:hypothetical protein
VPGNSRAGWASRPSSGGTEKTGETPPPTLSATHERWRLGNTSWLNPGWFSAANYLVHKDWPEQSPEDPERFSDSVEVLLSAKQFEWLTKQCEFLCIPKQQLVGDAMEEWFCRYQMRVTPSDVSATVRAALDEFIRRHGEEFL